MRQRNILSLAYRSNVHSLWLTLLYNTKILSNQQLKRVKFVDTIKIGPCNAVKVRAKLQKKIDIL
jgi:hypothetical protein